MKTIKFTMICFFSLLLVSCQKTPSNTEQKTGTLKISFKNLIKGAPMQISTGAYTNGFGEQYNITKFKYYISHVVLGGLSATSSNDSYYLIDETNAASLSFSFDAPVNTYSTVSFLLGVDSTRNVSGAQTGALDPLNDMFWTWNSGYIMAKMEGVSPQSTVVNNKVEYHIGGFAGANSVLKTINLSIPPSLPVLTVNIREAKTSEITINADFDKWWQGTFNLKIANNPAVTTPGALAKSISDNYRTMFSIAEIKNY